VYEIVIREHDAHYLKFELNSCNTLLLNLNLISLTLQVILILSSFYLVQSIKSMPQITYLNLDSVSNLALYCTIRTVALTGFVVNLIFADDNKTFRVVKPQSTTRYC